MFGLHLCLKYLFNMWTIKLITFYKTTLHLYMDVSRENNILKRLSSAGNHRIGHLTVKQNF